MVRVAINGPGHIVRAALKTVLQTPKLVLVVVNDIVPAENII
jgi:glyceraldehyde-3-phosphate dehydrogenase/erythrose-4-phosphate dehydrogenase